MDTPAVAPPLLAAVTALGPKKCVLKVRSSEAGGGADQDVFKDGCHPNKAGVWPGFEILSKCHISHINSYNFLRLKLQHSKMVVIQGWNPTNVGIAMINRPSNYHFYGWCKHV